MPTEYRHDAQTDRLIKSCVQMLSGKRVLELGAGTGGVAGISAWTLGADALLTDLQAVVGLP